MQLVKTLSLGLVTLGLLLLSSCEKEALTTQTTLGDGPAALEKAIVHHPDGSYSYEFTGAQVLDYVRRHHDGKIPTDSGELFALFGRLLDEQEADASAKTTTFSFRYRVETVLAQGDPIGDWIITGGGFGGVTPNVTPDFTFSTQQVRSQSSFFIMSAFVDANDNTGADAFSDADSSFDIGPCLSNKFGIRRIFGTATISWDSDQGTFSGDADVRCDVLEPDVAVGPVLCC